jgi:hypothetical protein
MSDVKISSLPEKTSPVGTDILYIKSDPAGTPADMKMTIANMFAAMSGSLLTAVAGTVTASKALIVDASKKLNELLVDNIWLDANTITTTNTDGTLILTANGSGKVSCAKYLNLLETNGNVGTGTLTANSTYTFVANTAVTANSRIFLFPTSAGAAADSSGTYILTKQAGVCFTIAHPSNATASKTFNYLIVN